MTDVSPGVERFVIEHIDSVHELEILLLLYTRSDCDWTGVTVARELKLDPLACTERLGDFLQRGLVVQSPSAADAVRYVPGSQVDDDLEQLTSVYPQQWNAIIRLIVSKPNRKVQSFPDVTQGDDEPDE